MAAGRGSLHTTHNRWTKGSRTASPFQQYESVVPPDHRLSVPSPTFGQGEGTQSADPRHSQEMTTGAAQSGLRLLSPLGSGH